MLGILCMCFVSFEPIINHFCNPYLSAKFVYLFGTAEKGTAIGFKF